MAGHLGEGHVRPTLEVIVTESPVHLRKIKDVETGFREWFWRAHLGTCSMRWPSAQQQLGSAERKSKIAAPGSRGP